ncbi:MAG TPA: hypothetical protein VGM92_02660 [Candidatus Kapabacteria bacterium]|jgi:hypothetical protein
MEPLPPVKEVEYRCYIGKLFEELSGTEHMTFAFETAKEFSSFRYEIAVRYRIQPGQLDFKVLGMTATRTMMPAFGTARSVLKIPLLPFGIYTVRMIKSDDAENIFSIEVTKKGVQILQPIPRKRFIDLVIEDTAASPVAKHLSTVSRAPQPPLVPRTIQKRIPMPGDPDYDEAMAEQQAEENEDDIFGAETKPGAKHVIDEIEEVPMMAKPVAKPKLEEKPVKESHVKETHGKEPHGKESHAKESPSKEAHGKENHAKASHASDKEAHTKEPHAKEAHAKESHPKKSEQKPVKTAAKPAAKAKPVAKIAPKPKAKPAAKAKPAKKGKKK